MARLYGRCKWWFFGGDRWLQASDKGLRNYMMAARNLIRWKAGAGGDVWVGSGLTANGMDAFRGLIWR